MKSSFHYYWLFGYIELAIGGQQIKIMPQATTLLIASLRILFVVLGHTD